MAWIAVLLCLCCLSGCEAQPERYAASYWDSFDTLIEIIGYEKSQDAFDSSMQRAHALLLRLHAVFDRYNAHPGVAGVYALNHAGGQPVQVEPELLKLLSEWRALNDSGGQAAPVNPALGTVIDIWKEYREQNAAVPDMDILQAANLHTSQAAIQIDMEMGTVQLMDAQMQLDLGAMAKGYAVEQLAQLLDDIMPAYLINAGGNVRAGKPPQDGRAHWTVALTDPAQPTDHLMRLGIEDLSVVTSGGYQRYYELNGVRYHHIIDPSTLMPGDRYLQTTVIMKDSGTADYLSTALFLLSYEEGLALAQSLGADAVWVMPDGTIQMTSGAQALVIDGAK